MKLPEFSGNFELQFDSSEKYQYDQPEMSQVVFSMNYHNVVLENCKAENRLLT